jgi:hypothetical protein
MAEYNAARWSFWLDERQKRNIDADSLSCCECRLARRYEKLSSVLWYLHAVRSIVAPRLKENSFAFLKKTVRWGMPGFSCEHFSESPTLHIGDFS